MNKLTTFALLALGTVALSACGGGGGAGPVIETTAPTYKEVSKDHINDAHVEGVLGSGATVITVDHFTNNTHGDEVQGIIQRIAPGATHGRIDLSGTVQGTDGDIYNLSIGAYDTNYVTGVPSEWHAHWTDYSSWFTNIQPDELLVFASGNHIQEGATCDTWRTCNSIAVAAIDATGQNVIVVGALDDDGNALTDYSVPAGWTKYHFISTYVDHETGEGTSYAAPVVSGTAALIMDKFDIDASDTRAIIFRTADDLGAPGVDDVYGHGRLNIKRALSPVGSLR